MDRGTNWDGQSAVNDGIFNISAGLTDFVHQPHEALSWLLLVVGCWLLLLVLGCWLLVVGGCGCACGCGCGCGCRRRCRRCRCCRRSRRPRRPCRPCCQLL